jgi:hypothetical protein
MLCNLPILAIIKAKISNKGGEPPKTKPSMRGFSNLAAS